MHSRTFRGIGAIGVLVGLCSLAGCGGGDDAAIAQGVAADVSGVTQNWDKVLPAAQRFTVLSSFNGEAVRDNETGLVWEKAPATATIPWNSVGGNDFASNVCIQKTVGGRKGWRLPTVAELASVIDPSQATTGTTFVLALPPGHPFLNLNPTGGYWSASTWAGNPAEAWTVSLGFGSMGIAGKNQSGRVWCVRGAMQESVY
jgi:Protein of unknown function (DUF1566)